MELTDNHCKPQAIAPAGTESQSEGYQVTTSQQDKHSVPAATLTTANLGTRQKETSTLWERALHDLSLDKGKQEMLDGYKKAAVSELIKCGLAAPESSALDIATLQRAELWLKAKSAEQTAGSRGRELAVNTAKAFSSITQILSSSGSVNPCIGLACAGLCILTLVSP
jgi:hypothetical protein